MIKILVCGGRDYTDVAFMNRTLDALMLDHDIAIVIEGGYRGADTFARAWANSRGIHCATIPAQWRRLGPRAGPARNSAMLALSPDIVVAFPGGTGTADMVTKAEAAGITTMKMWGDT